MECGQGDDEDNLMLCDGVPATNAILTLLEDELVPSPSNTSALVLGTAFKPMHRGAFTQVPASKLCCCQAVCPVFSSS